VRSSRRIIRQDSSTLAPVFGLDPGQEPKDPEQAIPRQDPTLRLEQLAKPHTESEPEPAPPTGTVTFLFTDIEGSTRLLREWGPAYADLLREHRETLRRVCEGHRGVEMGTQGDAFFAAFERAEAAVAAAASVQEAVRSGPVRVRIGIHTGEPILTEGNDYVGLDVHVAARIAAAAHGAQIVLSQSTRDLVATQFDVRDLGEHRLKDLPGPQRLYQLGGGEFAPLRSLHWTNLPAQTTPLIGRRRELAEVGDLVRRQRLVTLTGAGGSGKTRLAIEVATELVDDFQDGVWFVALAAVRDPKLVLATVAQTIGVTAPQTLDEHLRGKELLLVLDNFEHVLDAGPSVGALLRKTGGVKALVTSRARLRVAGEQEYTTRPLPNAEARRLFVGRAQALKPDFEANGVVAEICERVDNLPLAVELAAVRVKLLTPRALLARLDHRLPLLTSGDRDADVRQQTLRATIDWSYELLPPREQQLFSRLAVFAGGCTVSAAEEVAEGDLEALQSLVENSLLQQSTAGRLLMLETIREYALERLEISGAGARTRRKHATWYIEHAQAFATQAIHEGAATALLELEQEIGNLRAALAFLLEAGRGEEALELASTLMPLWDARRHVGEGRRWFSETLAAAPTAKAEVRARALEYSGFLAIAQNDHTDALNLLKRGLSQARAHAATEEVTRALRALGIVHTILGDYDAARAHLEESVALCRQFGYVALTARGLGAIAVLAAHEGDLRTARSGLEEAIRLRRELGDRRGLASEMANLGRTAMFEGNQDEAQSLLEDSLELAHELGDKSLLARVLANLGLVALVRQSYDDARERFTDALRIFADYGAPEGSAECFEGFARIAHEAGESRRATHLLSAAARIHVRTRATAAAPDRAVVDQLTADIRATLPDEEFDEAWTEGQRMTLDEALSYAFRSASSGRAGAAAGS
jgi:predicted ATPase/class 3 adenylate cyclase